MALALGGCDALSKLVGESVGLLHLEPGGILLLTTAGKPPTLSSSSFLATVVDIAPGIGKISPEFQAYLEAMKAIDEAKVHSRKEADAILSKTEPDLGVRQFLLTNLDRASPEDPYKFRLPLSYLRNAIDEIGHFPYTPGERIFDKPSLFLKGTRALSLFYESIEQLSLAGADAHARFGLRCRAQAKRANTSTARTFRSSSSSSRIRGSRPSTPVTGSMPRSQKSLSNCWMAS